MSIVLGILVILASLWVFMTVIGLAMGGEPVEAAVVAAVTILAIALVCAGVVFGIFLIGMGVG